MKRSNGRSSASSPSASSSGAVVKGSITANVIRRTSLIDVKTAVLIPLKAALKKKVKSARKKIGLTELRTERQETFEAVTRAARTIDQSSTPSEVFEGKMADMIKKSENNLALGSSL